MVATILLLLELFEAISPLVHILQSSIKLLNLNDLPGHLASVQSRLEGLREDPDSRTVFTAEKFEELSNDITDEVLSLPGSILKYTSVYSIKKLNSKIISRPLS